jgi:hypothetical protein
MIIDRNNPISHFNASSFCWRIGVDNFYNSTLVSVKGEFIKNHLPIIFNTNTEITRRNFTMVDKLSDNFFGNLTRDEKF